ncbi:hypothetical protein LTS18_010741 [Coniosporium uncinatum]|uniref:Uncharacterized protein n=1 Tax=Coniosporium uncinatum TaxID=93489 RepID=A0ACC3DA09_9PEZI|nr:hypothetical protein LTS18_010741 [Coniosporium uncinatum]
MATLDDLPPELIDNVASNLGSSLLQIRLVCRKYNLDSLHAFKTIFFSAKRFTIYIRSSLQVMVEIANHEVLGLALETLILGTDHYSANCTDVMALCNFIHVAACLTSLRLDLCSEEDEGHTLAQLAKNLRVAKLVALELECFNSTSNSLQQLIHAHASTLKYLVLRWATLLEGTWSALLNGASEVFSFEGLLLHMLYRKEEDAPLLFDKAFAMDDLQKYRDRIELDGDDSLTLMAPQKDLPHLIVWLREQEL